MRQKPTPGFMNIGRIVGTFGLKGQLKVEVMTDFPERLDPGSTVYLRGEPIKIKDLMWHQAQARIKLEGINKIDDAELLKWEYLQVPEDDRPDMEKNEFYARDLVGLTLVTEEGITIGVVEEIVAAPAQDLIRTGQNLIPMVKQFVKKIDIAGGKIIIRPIPGLLDDAAEIAGPQEPEPPAPKMRKKNVSR